MSVKTTLSWIVTLYYRMTSRVRCLAQRERMTAKFYISETQLAIVVFVPHRHSGGAYLWDSIIGHCAERFSPNELKEIRAQLWQILQRRAVGDIPYVEWNMFDELTKAMEKKKIQF
jgi:hypothetical protein